MKKFKEALDTMYKTTFDVITIFIGNPLDIAEIDMNEIPVNCYFIGSNHLDRGEMLVVKDVKYKKSFNNYIRYCPDRVVRGKKSYFNFNRSEAE